jgi:hypothetical protein
MRNLITTDVEVLAEKQGVPIYTTNPSVPTAEEIRRPKRTQLGTDVKGLVVDSVSGETWDMAGNGL